jgi:cytochrome b
MSTTSIRTWDLPTRLFHWTLVALFVGAFAVAHLANEHSPTFAIHMLLGLILAGAIVFRLVWGFVGSRHARFASFLFSPAALVGYLKDALAGRDQRYAGHNPGSSWAIYGMVLLPLGLLTTGVLSQPKNELFEEIHGALGWVMVAAVVAHLAGLAFYTWRHRENLALSMVTGKRLGEPEQAIPSSRPVTGVVFLALMAGWAAVVLRGHDPVAKVVRIPGLGITVPVAEKAPKLDRHGDRHDDDD